MYNGKCYILSHFQGWIYKHIKETIILITNFRTIVFIIYLLFYVFLFFHLTFVDNLLMN